MNKKILYIIIGMLVLFIFGSFFISLKSLKIITNGKVVKESNKNLELKNNLREIPEECKLPKGQDLESWKQHLSHHQKTLYCLKYFN